VLGMASDELEFHAFCLTDTGSRLDSYARAIARVIQPNDVVVDLGAGTGILSFLACQAGAHRVYAIESSEAIAYGELLATTRGYDERVRFVRGSSSRITLPERADALIADIHDTFGLQPGGLGSWIDARDRFLRPGGTVIPSHIQLLVAPVEAPELYRRTIDVWHQRIHGVDLAPIRALAVNQRYPARLKPEHLIAAPSGIAAIALQSTTALHVSGTVRVAATRSSTLHGICGCFVSTLGEGIEISNRPGDPGTTNFAQAFFPIETPHALSEGDDIAIHIDTFDGSQLRWRVEIVPRSGSEPRRFDHSTFRSTLVSAEALAKTARDYMPRLTRLGAVERALLDRFDGTTSIAQLEAWLLERFGDRLPSAREAAAFLKATIDRCG
jgi:predicted RNA methylase